MPGGRPIQQTDAKASASAQWTKLETLLHEALERAPEVRAEFLDTACPDPTLRREVDALIEAHTRQGPLDSLSDRVMSSLFRSSEIRPARRAEAAAPRAPARYRMIGRLGMGGMGIVYRARDERLERDVALKFLSPHLNADAAAKKRFLVEARAAASLEHPNICTVHEIGENDDGQLYIVMGFYEGHTLDRLIAGGPLSLPDALRIAAEVARGLGKAHERGIVHRDIKPANIMITGDGVVKILDFGIAKLADLNVTQTSGVLGTFAYMSPEQAFGEAVDARSDVWSLGVVLYEMLLGRRPFSGPGQQALIFALLTQEPEPISTLRTDATAEIDVLLGRAMAKRPEDRFTNAGEMLATLQRVQGIFVSHAPVVESEAPPPLNTDSLLTRGGERRQAAVVVTGISGYASLIERLPPDELDRVTNAVRTAAADSAAHHGGIVNHFAGDNAVLLFGVTEAHEDDFLRAVRAALDLHARVRKLSDELEDSVGTEIGMRSGVHVGPVVAQRQRSGDRRFRVTGAPLDLAARLATVADCDEVLISPECQRLVAPFIEGSARAPVALQPDAPPITPYRALRETDLHTRLEAAERAGLTPFAGRSRELNTVKEQLSAAVTGQGSVTVVIGEAGVGKSRLLHELRRFASEASSQLVMGRCDPYRSTTPYLPFVQGMRELLALGASEKRNGHHDDVVARVRAIDRSLDEFLPIYLTLLSIPSEQYPVPQHLQGEQRQAAMVEALAALFTLAAARNPLVLLLEDWHWADDASRVALNRLHEIAPSYPLLAAVTCRPESGIEWAPVDHRVLIQLGPLGLDAAREIMCAIFGAERVDGSLAQQLHDRTGGNPFFLEETCQALKEEGAVAVREGEAVAAMDSGAMQLPETAQAVIRTRLDRLDPEARDALRVASVIGREFVRGVLEQVGGAELELTRSLERLRASGLINQVSVMPEPRYRFKHALTQEVAYDTLLEHQRRTLHAAAGRAIERQYADRLDEHLERLAHHFASAEEWGSAVRYGVRASDRIASLSQFGDALSMLERVQQWLPHLRDESERRALAADVLLREERLCETLGLRNRQLELVEELITLLAPHGTSPKLAEAYLRQGDVFTLLGRFEPAARALLTSIRISRESGDRAAECNALRSMGLLRSYEGRLQEAVESYEAALRLDEEVLHQRKAAAGDLGSLANVLRRQGRHDEALRALERALAHLDEEGEDSFQRDAVLIIMASVQRELGKSDDALRLLEQVRDSALERRTPFAAAFALPNLARIYLEHDRTEEALDTYHTAVELCRRARYADGLAQALRALGETLFGLDRCADALPHLQEAARLFEQLKDGEAQTLMLSRIATVSERCHRPAEALSVWQEVRERCRVAGDELGELNAAEGVARGLRDAGDRQAATRSYEEALAVAMRLGEQEREISLRNTLGILYWEGGSPEVALGHFETALGICRSIGDLMHEGLILNSVGATLLRLGRHEEARTALEEGARVNATTGQVQLEAHSFAVLGDVMLASRRAGEAAEYFRKSLALRQELGDKRGEGWMQERLARAHDVLGDGDAARRFREAAAGIADMAGDEALARALGRNGGSESN